MAGLPAAAPGTLRVGLVATFARWKGQDLFLKAAAQMVQNRPGQPLRFYLIGGPIYRTRGSQFSEHELRLLALGLDIAPLVGFIGFQQHTADLYRALDIVVHASTEPEPFGLTIIEAMACSKPCASNARGYALISDNGWRRRSATADNVWPGRWSSKPSISRRVRQSVG